MSVLFRSFFLNTVIVAFLICFNVTSTTSDGYQAMMERVKISQQNLEIFKSFKIEDLNARLYQGEILVNWNIQLDLNYRRPPLDRKKIHLTVFTNMRYGRFVRENEVSLDMADCCIIKHMDSSTASCNYTVTPRSSCMNYKLVLRNKNDRSTVYVTNVPIKSNSTALEWTENAETPFKLNWEIGCESDYINPVTVTISSNNKTVETDHASFCAASQRICSIALSSSNFDPCVAHIINLNNQSSLNLTTYPGNISLNVFNITSEDFVLEWIAPVNCQQLTNLTLVDKHSGKIIFISGNLDGFIMTSDNCTTSTCHMVWKYPEKIQSCRTYIVSLGSFHMEFTTLPDMSKEFASADIAISIEQLRAVLSWNSSQCQNTEIITGWQILSQHVRSSNASFINFTDIVLNNENNSTYTAYEYSIMVEECKTYNFTVLGKLRQTDKVFVAAKIFKTPCSISLLTGSFIAIGALLVIGLAVVVFFSCFYKKIRSPVINKRASTKMSVFDRSKTSSFTGEESSEITGMDFINQLPHMQKRMLNTSDICSFDVSQARMEFFFINKMAELDGKKNPQTAAMEKKNKNKNRCKIHPFDFNRVILYRIPEHEHEHHDEDYINASFIPGFTGSKREYIATQLPMKNTLEDFWQMIWEQEVQFIVMIDSLSESCITEMCAENYWPEKGSSLSCGIIQADLISETAFSFYTDRRISVSNKLNGCVRMVRQFHFIAWPVFEKLNQFGDSQDFIQFIEIIRKETAQLVFFSSIVVHCSDGAGRTGTFIALDCLIQQSLVTDKIDIAKTVYRLRGYRSLMVQFESQYVFLYACMSHYIKNIKRDTKKPNPNLDACEQQQLPSTISDLTDAACLDLEKVLAT